MRGVPRRGMETWRDVWGHGHSGCAAVDNDELVQAKVEVGGCRWGAALQALQAAAHGEAICPERRSLLAAAAGDCKGCPQHFDRGPVPCLNACQQVCGAGAAAVGCHLRLQHLDQRQATGYCVVAGRAALQLLHTGAQGCAFQAVGNGASSGKQRGSDGRLTNSSLPSPPAAAAALLPLLLLLLFPLPLLLLM